jgi:hypothetical protein
MNLKSLFAGAVLAATVSVGAAFALPINSPVPSSAFIVFHGLDWAWGGACPYSGGCFATGDLSYQGTQGWSLPSASDMALVDAFDSSNPGAFAELFLNNPGGNVPAGGSDPVSGAFFSAGGGGSCAAPYFDTAAPWCDDGDGLLGAWNGSVLGANYAGDGNFFDEQLYVRAAVPEPGEWALLMAGLAMVGAGLRLSRKSASAALA